MDEVNLRNMKCLLGRTKTQYLKFLDDDNVPSTLANASKAVFCSETEEELFFISESDYQSCILYDSLDKPKFRIKFTRKGASNCFGIIEKRKYIGVADWEWMLQFPIFSFSL